MRPAWHWDPAVWREPGWMLERRSLGVRVWISGGELQLGRLMWRVRWMSR